MRLLIGAAAVGILGLLAVYSLVRGGSKADADPSISGTSSELGSPGLNDRRAEPPPTARVRSITGAMDATEHLPPPASSDSKQPSPMPSVMGPAHERAISGDWDVARARRRIRDALASSMWACIQHDGPMRFEVEAYVAITWRSGEALTTLLSHEVLTGDPAALSTECLDSQFRSGKLVALPDSPDHVLADLRETRESFRLFLAFEP